MTNVVSPLPWEAKREDRSENGWCVYDATGMLVARRLTEANARLIASISPPLPLPSSRKPWEKIPSVTPGGKPFFYTRRDGDVLDRVVWNRIVKAYAASRDHVPVGYFATVEEAQAALD